MTTYSVTIQTDNGPERFLEVTQDRLNRMRKNYGKAVKATKNEAPKFWYYRGVQVIWHEDRQNNWSLVSNVDGSHYFYLAVTSEMEYR